MNPERMSAINEVVSQAPETKKEMEKRFSERFFEQEHFYEQKDIRSKEIEKNSDEIKMINLINEKTDTIRKKYGLKSFKVSPDNIHIFNEEDYNKINKTRDSLGLYSSYEQGIAYKKTEKDAKVRFARIIYHELTHLKHFQKYGVINNDDDPAQMTPEKIRRNKKNVELIKDIPNAEDICNSKKREFDQDFDSFIFQSGIMIETKEENKEYWIKDLAKDIPNTENFCDFLREGKRKKHYYGLGNLDEALTEELSIRFQKNVLRNIPDLKEEFDLIGEYVEQEKKAGREIDPDDVVSARKKIIYTIENKESYEVDAQLIGYGEQRKILNMLIDKLYENNKDTFQNREEIFDLIAKSSFTGNLVGEKSWGRLVDKTFGKNTFKELVDRDKMIGATMRLKEFVESLKPIEKPK